MPPPRPPLLTAAFARILALQASFSVALTSFVLLPKFLAVELAAPPSTIGGVMASFSVANVLCVPLVGIGVDRLGRRALVFVGCALMLGSALGFVAVDRVGPLLYLLRGLQGAGFACVYISSATLVTDRAPPERLSQALALMGATMHAVASVVPWIVERGSERLGWDAVFWGAAGAALLGGVLATQLRTPARPEPHAAETAEAPGLGAILRRGSLRRSAIVFVVAGAAVATMTTFVQPYALERGIPRVAGFFVAFSLTVMAVRVLVGAWLDRANRQRICAAATAGYAVVLLATGDLDATRLPLLGVLFGLAHGLFMPSFNAMNLKGVPARERGRVVSMLSGSFNVGLGLGTFALGQVAAAAGYPACFEVAALAAALACALLLAFPNPSRWSAAGDVPPDSRF